MPDCGCTTLSRYLIKSNMDISAAIAMPGRYSPGRQGRHLELPPNNDEAPNMRGLYGSTAPMPISPGCFSYWPGFKEQRMTLKP